MLQFMVMADSHLHTWCIRVDPSSIGCLARERQHDHHVPPQPEQVPSTLANVSGWGGGARHDD